MRMHKKVVAAFATLAIAFLPTAAQAVETLTITDGTNPITSIVNGDHTNVTAGTDIVKTGAQNQSIMTQWSPESLQLQDPSAIVSPEGWTLEYTTDGKTWTETVPTDTTTVRAIRTKGDINSLGNSMFSTTTVGEVTTADSTIQGSGGGDGYDASVWGDYVYNVYHHVHGLLDDLTQDPETSLGIDCHIKAIGAACWDGAFWVNGYSTTNAPSAFFDSASNKLYVAAGRDSDFKVGFLCVNLADFANPATCSTPFYALSTVHPDYQGTEFAFAQGSQAQIGNKVYFIDGTNAKLECFDISTATECANSTISVSGTAGDPSSFWRLGAFGSKLYYFSDTSIGCYDPALPGHCNGSTPLTLDLGANPAFAPFPVTNSSGTLIGVCNWATHQCIDSNGAAASVFPSALATFASSHQQVGEWLHGDSGKFGWYGTRLYIQYYGVTPESGGAPNDVYCFNYATGAECAGFDGTNLGAQIYAISADPVTAGCIWTNGNMGKLTTFQFDTGAPGCDFGTNAIIMPYSAIAPRMACNEEGRVISWDTATFALPAGLSDSELFVSFLDVDGNGIDAYTNIHPVSGVIDMSGLPYETTDTQDGLSIKITAVAGEAALSSITAVVKFEAENPQLCLDLEAVTNCPTFEPAPTGDTIPDGRVSSLFVTTPNSGAKATKTVDATLTGSNTTAACAATLFVPAPDELAFTGDSDFNGKVGMGVAGLLAMISAVAMVVYNRRKQEQQ